MQNGETLIAISFELQEGALLGAGDLGNIYKLDMQTGVAESFAHFPTAPTGTGLGMYVTDSPDHETISLLGANGTALQATNLTESSPVFPPSPAYGRFTQHPDGAQPAIIGAALFSNSDPAAFGIDATTNSTVVLSLNTNAVAIIKALDVTPASNIAGMACDVHGQAFAAFDMGGYSNLYIVDVWSGKTVSLGKIGNGVLVRSIAIPQTWVWADQGQDNHWSTPENWNTDTPPQQGVDVHISGESTYNDLPSDTDLRQLQIAGATDSADLFGNSLVISGGVSGPATIHVPIRLEEGAQAQISFLDVTLTGSLNLHGQQLSVSGLNGVHLQGAVTDDVGGGRIESKGTLNVEGPVAAGIPITSESVTNLPNTGILTIRGDCSGSVVNSYGFSVDATGTVGSLQASGTSFHVGNAVPGSLTVNGDLQLGSSTTFYADVSGVNPGTGFDQVTVKGSVTLGYASLSLNTHGLLVPVGSSIELINNQGSGPIYGTFAGLSEGQEFYAGNESFFISYTGGDGNDVVITRAPPQHVTSSDAQFYSEPVMGLFPEVPFSLHLSTENPNGLTVHIKTRDGTAVGGVDYVPIDEDLVFDPHTSSSDIYVQMLPNPAIGPNKIFYLDITGPSYAMIDQPEVSATVHYIGTFPVLSVQSEGVLEGNTGKSSIHFTAKLDHSYPFPVTTEYHTSGSSADESFDFESVSGELTFNPGVTSADITVDVLGDKTREANEYFNLNFTRLNIPDLAGPVARGYIIDDDTPRHNLFWVDSGRQYGLAIHDTLGHLNSLQFFGISTGYDLLTLKGVDFNSDLWSNRLDGDQITITPYFAHGVSHNFHVGAVDARGTNLRSLKIRGDLGFIGAGSGEGQAIGTLNVDSFGGFDPDRDELGSLSLFEGGAGKLVVHDSIYQAHIEVRGKMGSLFVKGDLQGGETDQSGEIYTTKGIGKAWIGGWISGYSGQNSGRISTGGDIGSLHVGGSLSGGGDFSGSVHADGRIGLIRIGGDVNGGFGQSSGSITALGALGNLTVAGNVTGDAGDFSGEIASQVSMGKLVIGGDLVTGAGLHSGSIFSDGDIQRISIGGSLRSDSAKNLNGILADGCIGSIYVGGDLFGPSSFATFILAGGLTANGEASTFAAIGNLTVRGSVSRLALGAGYDNSRSPVNNAAWIGNIRIHGDLTDSDITAGAVTGDDKLFGTSDDAAISTGFAGVSKINSIVVSGKITDDDFPHGIVAGVIGKMKVDGHSLPLTPSEDDILLVAGMYLHELVSP